MCGISIGDRAPLAVDFVGCGLFLCHRGDRGLQLIELRACQRRKLVCLLDSLQLPRWIHRLDLGLLGGIGGFLALLKAERTAQRVGRITQGLLPHRELLANVRRQCRCLGGVSAG